MKRLIKKSEKYIPKKGDYVQWKKHPFDESVYQIIEILPNGNVFMDNGKEAFTDVKPSVIKLKPAN